MTTATIVISLEFAQLPRPIDCIPEEHAIKILAHESCRSVFHRTDAKLRTYGTDLILSILSIRRFAIQRWKRNSGPLSALRCLGNGWAEIAELNVRQTDTPWIRAGATPKPMMRRVKTSMTSITEVTA